MRDRYCAAFLDAESAARAGGALTVRQQPGGPGYTGYLWDHFSAVEVIGESAALQQLGAVTDLIAMWDLHSPSRVVTPDYFKLPYGTVLRAPGEVVVAGMAWLPEDLYLFDDSLQWTIALTHEWVDDERYCLLVSL